MLNIQNEVASGRIDQLGQGRQRRLTPSGFISADHTLRHTRPEGQFGLRHPRTDPSLPQQAPGRFTRAIHEADYSGLSISRWVRYPAALQMAALLIEVSEAAGAGRLAVGIYAHCLGESDRYLLALELRRG